MLCLFLIWLEYILNEGVFDGQKLRKLILQLRGVKLVVASRGNNHLSLLLQSEVLPCKVRIHVFLVHL